jgi:hypothetical protein
VKIIWTMRRPAANGYAAPAYCHAGHVIARFGNGPQRAAIFGREGPVEVLGEVLRTQQHGRVHNPAATIFATQLDGTGWHRLTWLVAVSREMSPKTLTSQHALGRPGIAESEFQDRCLKPLGHPSTFEFARIFFHR